MAADALGTWTATYTQSADQHGRCLRAPARSPGISTGWSGSLTNANVYRFSSKEYHAKSGMYGYGFRFYDPHLQRWINRDPIFEAGGINLYGFVGNNPMMFVDPYGLYSFGEWLQIVGAFCQGPEKDWLTRSIRSRQLWRIRIGWQMPSLAEMD